MLKELTFEKQIKQGRRWFSDDYFDLIVWIGQDLSISGFQLCYDKQQTERALTWKMEEGFSHERVDEGEDIPGKDRTPILKPDGLFPVQEIMRQFKIRSAEIDPQIMAFILGKIDKYY